MSRYDPEAVNAELLAICDHYCGARRRSGVRWVYQCPECGDREDFQADPGRGVGGCFSSGCPVTSSTDALGLISYFEGLERRGRDFIEIMKIGYGIAGIPEPEEERQRSGKGSRGRGGVEQTEERPREQGREAPAPGGEIAVVEAHEEEGEQNSPSVRAEPLREGKREEPAVRPVEAWEEGPDGERVPIEASIVVEEEEREASGGGRQPYGREQSSRHLTDAVLSALMAHCPIEDRDMAFWESRGVGEETVTRGDSAHCPRRESPTFSESSERSLAARSCCRCRVSIPARAAVFCSTSTGTTP